MSTLDASLDTLAKTRQSLVAITDALEDEARLRVPDGFKNHILWNLAHVVVTQQLLVYGLSGLPLHVPDEWIQAYRKGTSATTGESVASYDEVRQAALELPPTTRADLEAGRFETFRSYTTTPGVVLESVHDADRFNLYHEGLHLGTILALRKLV